MDETLTQVLEGKDAKFDAGLVKVRKMLNRSRVHLERGERNYALAVSKDAVEKLSALVG